MNVLGIETSCDETAAAVVRDGRWVLSNIIHTQIALHSPHGGVVPELASRSHVENLPHIVETAVREAGLGWTDIDAVAMTTGPGLASSLLVGMSTAKALALRLQRPLCAVNHLHGHLHSIFLDPALPDPASLCPLLVLLVSGGHTALLRLPAPGDPHLLGQTLDDAAGEAFDKGAKLLGLGYPGGPAIDRIARDGNRMAVHFPRGRLTENSRTPEGLDPALCFSFSGLKTALLYHLRAHGAGNVADLAASYQEAIVDALLDRIERAHTNEGVLAAVGGVALNSRLRVRLEELAQRLGVRLIPAGRAYCTDNAAMIAGAAGAGHGLWGEAAFAVDAEPSLGLALPHPLAPA